MATKIVTKNSSTAGSAPLASDLVQGELAVNVTDKRLYTEDNAGAVVELGTNPSTLTVTGEITANGGIALGDNDKATFGASDDLQIYHDGSDSYIKEDGTGNLIIAADDFRVTNVAVSELMIAADTDGSVSLYHNGSSKLATTATGIDVTGTVTAGDSSANADLILTEGSTNTDARIRNSNGILEIDADLNNEFGNSSMMFAVDGVDKLKINNNGDISFYEDTGTTPKFFWDASAESLGIGTSSPTVPLHIVKAATGVNQATDVLRLSSVDTLTSYYVGFQTQRDNSAGMGLNILTTNVAGTVSESMRIDTSGNVGIGTSSPSVPLDIKSANSASIKWQRTGVSAKEWGFVSDNDQTYLYNFTDGITSTSFNNNGNVGIGTSAPTLPLSVDGDIWQGNTSGVEIGRITNSAGWYDFGGSSNVNGTQMSHVSTLRFVTNTAERMRIDASGKVLVGKTVADLTTTGIQLSNEGFISASRPDVSAVFNRRTTDGDIMLFRQDGTTVGSIGTDTGGNLQTLSSTGNYRFGDSNTTRWSVDVTRMYPMSDATYDIGLSSNRVRDLYLSGGVYLGGTGAANHLDDYEEGGWTGTLTGSTSAPSTAITATGTYTKIGRSVTAVIAFSNRDSTGVSGVIQVTGLPFTAAAGGLGAGWHSRSNTGTGTTNGVMSYISSNNDLVLLDGLGGGITWVSTGTGTYAGYSITYEV